MADASCSGPSPFKRLVDHQTRDVSHHQDRLRNASGTAYQTNGFRSQTPTHQAQDGFGHFLQTEPSLTAPTHDPAGRLAVHAAALQPTHSPHHHHHHLAQQNPSSPSSHHHQALPAPAAANWASDFTRFASQSTSTAPGPSPHQLSSNSATAFHQPMTNQSLPEQHMNFAAAFGLPQSLYQQPPQFRPMQQSVAGQSDFDQEVSRWMASNGGGAGNMEQVDAAMEQMARELELNEAALASSEPEAASSSSTAAQPVQQDSQRYTDLETPEIGSLSLRDRTAGNRPAETWMPPQEDDSAAAAPTQEEDGNAVDSKSKSAVSEAAERLLETVQHEDGDKWKNSAFLSLMRDFRDGRKDIVGDEVRQTD